MKYIVNRSIKINHEEENGEVKYICYNMDEQRIFVLNSSAYEIFCLIDKVGTKELAIEELKNRYEEIDDPTIKIIEQAIEGMLHKDILLVAD